MAEDQVASILQRILQALDHGVPLDWTDIRVSLVLFLGSGIGALVGAYASSYFAKRGEIAAIRKDLDLITKLTEEIKAQVSKQLWIDQNFWTLKREVYWKFTSTLSAISTALCDLLHQGFRPDKQTRNPDPSVTGPLRNRLDTLLDELIGLTAPSHIVLCPEAITIIKTLPKEFGETGRQFLGNVGTYEHFDRLRVSVDKAYDRLIEVARLDLQGSIGNAISTEPSNPAVEGTPPSGAPRLNR